MRFEFFYRFFFFLEKRNLHVKKLVTAILVFGNDNGGDNVDSYSCAFEYFW